VGFVAGPILTQRNEEADEKNNEDQEVTPHQVFGPFRNLLKV
jgi:hypothetical protein